MKKNILYYLTFMLIGGLFVTSCTKDEDENQFQEITNVKGGVINLSAEGPGFFNLGDAAATTGFSLDDFGEAVSSVTVLKSVNGGTAVEETKVTSFPSSLSFSLTDALAGTGLTANDVAVGDEITYTFADVVTSSGSYPSGRSITIPITCPGQLAGEFDVETTATGVFTNAGETYTGKVIMEDAGAGNFNVLTQLPGTEDFLDDPSFGAYYAGYGTTNADGLPNGGGTGNVQINETCGLVSYVGTSQWDETYTISSLNVDGATLSLVWENSYGEGGNVTITRTDGTEWASNLTN